MVLFFIAANVLAATESNGRGLPANETLTDKLMPTTGVSVNATRYSTITSLSSNVSSKVANSSLQSASSLSATTGNIVSPVSIFRNI